MLHLILTAELVKKQDERAEGPVLATIELGESELLKLHGQIKTDPNALTEESTINLRKALIAIQLVRSPEPSFVSFSSNCVPFSSNMFIPVIFG